MTDWIEHFQKILAGLRVSHVWRGYGSALFLELGALTPTIRRDGSPGIPEGQAGIMLEESWRIEETSSILCGSWSEEELWRPSFDQLKGREVTGLSVFGRLPEISIALAGGLYVSSFTITEGNPCWTLFDRNNPSSVIAASCEAGKIVATKSSS